MEALKAALWRSRWLLLLSAIAGVLAVNGLTHLLGERYEAQAQVLVSDRDLGSALTGSQPAFVDPQRTLETELALARSREVYARAARATGGRLGSVDDLDRDVEVQGDGSRDILSFVASRDTPKLAQETANAVAAAYRSRRAQLAAQPIDESIRQARAALEGSPASATLQDKLDTLTILRTLSTGNTTLASAAVEASQTRPDPVQDTLLGLSIGLLVGLLVTALREAFDTSVRSEVQVEDLLGVPVIGSVGRLPRGRRVVVYGRQRARFEDDYALLAAGLEHLRPTGACWALLVTSAGVGEGKTTVAVNLAVTLARRGSRVLLVDFDFRRPTLGPALEIPARSTGVAQALDRPDEPIPARWSCSLDGSGAAPVAGGTWIRAASEEVAMTSPGGVRAPEGALDVLPSGGSVSGAEAVRLARSDVLAELMRTLRTGYDWVIIDTPPATRTVEVTTLSGYVDGILVVVRQGRASRRGLRMLQRQSRGWKAPATGAVLTDVAQDRGNRYYSSS